MERVTPHPGSRLTHELGVCQRCVSLASPRDLFCGACALARPADGWESLRDARDPWLGEVIADRYLIAQRLGIGGSARVYRAEATQLRRRFALKITELDANNDSEAVEARIAREIAAVKELRNPHIIPIYEVIQPSRRTIGLLMAFADGVTLQRWLFERGPLDIEQALEIVRQVADGLEEAHAGGVIHRDVKPDNLMIHEMPSGDLFVRIMDFGIAHVERSAPMTHDFIGTPLYASPEQVMGGAVGAATDAYGIGATLYAALTGAPPFARGTHVEILRAHLVDPIPRLSDVHGQQFGAELESFVARLLSKKPDDRPQSMRELIEEIDDLRQMPGWSDVSESSLLGRNEILENSETIRAQNTSTSPLADHITPAASRMLFGAITSISCGRVVSLVDGELVVSTLDRRSELRCRVPFADTVSSVAASTSTLWVGTRDGRLLSDNPKGWTTELSTPDRAGIGAIATTRSGDFVVVGTLSGDVFVRRRRSPWTQLDIGSPVRALAVSPSGSFIAVATWDKVRVIPLVGGERLAVEKAGVTSVAFSDDEYLVATATRSGEADVWAAKPPVAQLFFSARQEDAVIEGIHFGADGLIGLCHNGVSTFLVDFEPIRVPEQRFAAE